MEAAELELQADDAPAGDDALEIAVSSTGADPEVSEAHDSLGATVSLLHRDPAQLDDAHERESGLFEELFELDDEDILLEPSDLIEITAARTGAGLEMLEEGQLEADELDDFQPELLLEESPSDELELAEPSIDIETEPEPEPEPQSGDTLVDAVIEVLDDEAEFDDSTQWEPEPELASAAPDPLSVPFWSGLNTSAYALARGLRGMGQSPLVQLLAVGTMAVCMLLLGTMVLLFDNAQQAAHDLGVDTPVTVYMEPGADADATLALRERLAGLPEVAEAERVSPDMALARLQEGAGLDSERAALLAGVDVEYLPDSVELQLAGGVEPGFADALASRVEGMEGVEEVAVLGPWVQQVDRMVTTLRWLALGVALLVSLACLAIVWSTIRLGVFARRSELQILRLVGGTTRFVRGPFVVEGVVQGVLGTALALAGLWLGFELVRPFLERGMSLMFAAGSLHFFSMLEMGLALGFGALIGLIGSRAAVARHAEI